MKKHSPLPALHTAGEGGASSTRPLSSRRAKGEASMRKKQGSLKKLDKKASPRKTTSTPQAAALPPEATTPPGAEAAPSERLEDSSRVSSPVVPSEPAADSPPPEGAPPPPASSPAAARPSYGFTSHADWSPPVAFVSYEDYEECLRAAALASSAVGPSEVLPKATSDSADAAVASPPESTSTPTPLPPPPPPPAVPADMSSEQPESSSSAPIETEPSAPAIDSSPPAEPPAPVAAPTAPVAQPTAALVVGEHYWMQNPYFSDGTRLRIAADPAAEFNDQFVLNDVEVELLGLEKGFALVCKPRA